MNTTAEPTRKDKILRFLILNAGLIIVALGSYLFKNPNRFASGGVNGLAIILQYFYPQAPIGFLMLLMNIALLGVGFLFVGKDFAVKSIYGSLMLSVYIWLLEAVLPFHLPLTNQKLLELFYGVFLSGFGSTLVFYHGASTGGTDIVAKILSKNLNVKISTSILLSDFFIALASGIYGAEVLLYSLFGVVLKVFVMDSFLENLQVRKIFVIVTALPDEIKEFIVVTLHRGATISDAQGAFTAEKKSVITTVLTKNQAIRLQKFIAEADPHAFVTITNSSNIIGRGFASSI